MGSARLVMDSAKPDILCLNEIKITEDMLIKDEIKEIMTRWFPKDLQFWNCCKGKMKNGLGMTYHGVAIFVN